MILSSYRNPPYRTPTPKGKSISPPPGPSPKRKRTDSQSAGSGPALQINTDHVPASIPETPADSPRTNVTERLRDLDISQTHPTTPAVRDGDASPRKRLKRNAHLKASETDLDLEVYSTPEPSSQAEVHSRGGSPLEISEILDWRSRLPSSPPSFPVESQTQPSNANLTAGGTVQTKSIRFLSPPPAKSPASPETKITMAMELSSSPAESDGRDSIDRATLTWQESEITGQDIDTNSPDDDGEGINGIGFRPTPAMAYARSQRRKQQVNEWKAREAREARQRRIERRRGAAAAEIKAGQGMKRSVRFEGVG